jgi:hypothetical protein
MIKSEMEYLNWLEWIPFEWIETNLLSVVLAVGMIVLVIINAVYLRRTRKAVELAVQISSLAYNPVVGIRLGKILLSKEFSRSRRQLTVDLDLINVGNAPALEVSVDAGIILHYSDIEEEKVIPARHQLGSIPFIRPGEELLDDPRNSPNFGNTLISCLLADFEEINRLGRLRTEAGTEEEVDDAPKLKIWVYYKNLAGQYFESVYETSLSLGHADRTPKGNDAAEIFQMPIPRPKFYASPISKRKLDKELSERDNKRDLCGW